MAVRRLSEDDYEELAELYKRFYRVHNVFTRPDDEILGYLGSQEGECLVFDDGGIRGAVFLENSTTSPGNMHRLWKLKHLAFDSEDACRKLLAEAEKIIMDKPGTAKIEINVAESEPSADFYEELGYKNEAELRDHYRNGEKCFVFSKSFA